MKPVYQTLFGERQGNCFQAAIASLFELPLEDVPHFCRDYGSRWYEEFVLWLNKRGYSVVTINIKDCHLQNPELADCYYIVNGENEQGVRHSVIYKGGRCVHDSHKDGLSIKPDSIDIIFPLDPARMQLKGATDEFSAMERDCEVHKRAGKES